LRLAYRSSASQGINSSTGIRFRACAPAATGFQNFNELHLIEGRLRGTGIGRHAGRRARSNIFPASSQAGKAARKMTFFAGIEISQENVPFPEDVRRYVAERVCLL
jgi:hypothetical protein